MTYLSLHTIMEGQQKRKFLKNLSLKKPLKKYKNTLYKKSHKHTQILKNKIFLKLVQFFTFCA